jgi:hypothetical protein
LACNLWLVAGVGIVPLCTAGAPMPRTFETMPQIIVNGKNRNPSRSVAYVITLDEDPFEDVVDVLLGKRLTNVFEATDFILGGKISNMKP